MTRWGGALVLAAVTGCTLINDYPAVRDAGNAAALREALRDSSSGDYVRVTATVVGTFEVPRGVIVVGTETGGLEVPEGSIGLDLEGSDDPSRPTVVQDLRIVTRGRAGVRARSGYLRFENVRVDAEAPSVAVFIEDADRVELRGLRLFGDQSRDLFLTATDSTGLVLRRVADAQLSDVEARYFGLASAALVDSTVTWQGGRASEGGRFGLLVHSSSVTIANVDASGLRGLLPDAGILISGDSDVRAERVLASLGGSHGLVQIGGRSVLSGLEARGNSGLGVAIQDAESAEVQVLAERNFAVGLLAVDVQRLRIDDSVIREHSRSDVIVDFMSVPFGDGVEIVRSFSDLRIGGTAIDTSFRVGLLLVADGASIDASMFEDVRISGFDDQFGAVQQNGEVDDDWDRGILRSPAITANDSGNVPAFESFERFPDSIADLSRSISAEGLDALPPPDDGGGGG